MAPMRDGVELATDVRLPEGDGPFPVILGRTPYNKNMPTYNTVGTQWNARGYALVVQDCRGRGDSDGHFVPYRNEARDGHDAVEWVAQQDWCDGNVIIQGGSYGARIAWLTALQQPAHLRGLIVSVAPSDPFVEWPTIGESPMSISWYRLTDRRMVQGFAGVDWMTVYQHLPLQTLDEAAGFTSENWREQLRHTRFDEHWEPLCYQSHMHELDLPALHISGWYDDEQIGTPLNYSLMVRGARSDAARAAQRLLMGPWGHAINSTSKLGEVDFGSGAVIDLPAYMADFADGVLGRGSPPEQSPVRIFLMGENRWRDERQWPPATVSEAAFHLHSGGAANSRHGDGVLTEAAPAGDQPADRFTYEPSRPVPFLTAPESSQIGGPDDYAAVELRGDVLCYSTPPLEDDLTVIGPVRLRLFGSSSAVDTDFTGMLVDVHPSGFCQRLCDGIVRARYREGVDHAVLMDPGTVYELDIDMWNTSHVFKTGHRLRLDVTSSAFPKFDRNLNTGEDLGTSTRMLTAENTVWHDAAHPSRLLVQVERGTA